MMRNLHHKYKFHISLVHSHGVKDWGHHQKLAHTQFLSLVLHHTPTGLISQLQHSILAQRQVHGVFSCTTQHPIIHKNHTSTFTLDLTRVLHNIITQALLLLLLF